MALVRAFLKPGKALCQGWCWQQLAAGGRTAEAAGWSQHCSFLSVRLSLSLFCEAKSSPAKVPGEKRGEEASKGCYCPPRTGRAVRV